MKFKHIVFTAVLILGGLQFITIKMNILVSLSFLISFLVIISILYYHLYKEKQYSPILSAFIIFNLLFFIISPIVQIMFISEGNYRFVNFYPYTIYETIKANILITIFNIIFFLSYVMIKTRVKIKPNITKDSSFALYTLCVLLVCIVLIYFNLDYIDEKLSRPNWKLTYDDDKSSKLIISKTFFSVPLAGFALGLTYLRKNKKHVNNFLLVFLITLIFFAFLVFLKNPFMEKRSALGPIYFVIIYLLFPKVINSNAKTIFILFLTMVVAFPIASIFTHVNASFIDVVKNPSLLEASFHMSILMGDFNSQNFDAFSNFVATMGYQDLHGLSYGFQLLGGLLFFIPRSIWITKPMSSGEMIGRYLMDEHDFWFFNLSNPFVSEGYLNFGILGVILFAVVLAFIAVKCYSWFMSDDILKKIAAFYFAIHLIYFLRGDFTNGLSQYVGVFVGIYIIPKTIKLLLNWSIKLTKKQ